MGFVNPQFGEPRFGQAGNVNAYTPEEHATRITETQQQEGSKATAVETGIASFEMNNIILSHSKFIENRPGEPTPLETQDYITGKFSVMESIPEQYKKNPDLVEQYVKNARNEREAAWITGNIEREFKNRQAMEDNPVSGLLFTIAAASTSPEQVPLFAIPAGKALKIGALANLSTKSAIAYEGGVAGVAAGLGEAALHQSQFTRTKLESAYAVGGSVLLGSALTGFVYGFKGGAKALRELDDDMTKIDSNPQAQSMSAAKRNLEEPLPDELAQRVQTEADEAVASGKITEDQRHDFVAMRERETFESLSELKHPTLAKTLGFMHPSLRIARSSVASAREMGQKLVVDSMLRIGNKFGMTSGQAAETLIDSLISHTGERLHVTSGIQYNNYVKSLPDKRMTPDEFEIEVGKAMARKDLHENEFVQAAASDNRRIVADVEKRLLDAGLLDRAYEGFENLTPAHLEQYMDPDKAAKFFREDGSPIKNINKKLGKELTEVLESDGALTAVAKLPYGDESYFHRLWDFDKIGANEQQFLREVRAVLRDEARSDLTKMVAREQDKLADLKAEFGEQKRPVADTGETRAQSERSILKAAKKEQLEKANRATKNYNQRIKAEMNKADPDFVQIKKLEDARAKSRAEFKKAAKQDAIPLAQRIREKEIDIENMIASHERYRMQQLENEVKNAAREIKDSLTGVTAKQGQIIKSFDTGPLKNRTFMVKSQKLEGWINRNSSQVWNNWIEDVTPGLILHEKFGSVDLVDDIKVIRSNYEDAIEKLTDKKAQAKLQKERDGTIRDIEAMVESLHGRYKVPDDPTSAWSRAGRNLRAFNFVTMLGMMTVSAIPDVGHIIMRRGFKSMAKGLANLVTFNKGTKMSNKMWRKFGIASDLRNNQRINRTMFLDDQYARQNKFDRAVMKGTALFSKVTGMVHWNAAWKQFAATTYADDMLSDAIAASKGKLSAAKIQQYAQGGVSKRELNAIAKEIEQQTDNVIDGVYLSDPDRWGDQGLAERYRAAILREVDMTIVTPGKGDLPLASRSELGRLALQFKSFAMSANLRVLIASLDDFNAKKMIGLMSMIFFGGVSQLSRDAIQGKKVDYSSEEGLKNLFDNAVDRSGFLGALGDVNAAIEKLTRGGVSIKLGDKPLSRYQSRNILGTILGPMGGRVEDALSVVSAISAGEYGEREARVTRRLGYMNNLIWTYWAFDQIERAIGGTPLRDK